MIDSINTAEGSMLDLQALKALVPVGSNPKDLIGSSKVSISKLPASAVAWGSMAMMDGATKYGPYNFRDIPVQASIYVDAAKRHLDLWFEGQETASDSKVHHLGHALACCAILIDCLETGHLVDDRPKTADPDWYERFLTKLSEIIKSKKASNTSTNTNTTKETK